jgi:hypothetical protein
MTQREAVYAAIEEIGDRTKMEVLLNRASMLYGSAISYTACCSYRSQWRKENEIEGADCRTYEGQPRRNMRNDHAVSLQQVKRLATFLGKCPALALKQLIGDGAHAFHSCEQLRNALDEVAFIKAAA